MQVCIELVGGVEIRGARQRFGGISIDDLAVVGGPPVFESVNTLGIRAYVNRFRVRIVQIKLKPDDMAWRRLNCRPL